MKFNKLNKLTGAIQKPFLSSVKHFNIFFLWYRTLDIFPEHIQPSEKHNINDRDFVNKNDNSQKYQKSSTMERSADKIEGSGKYVNCLMIDITI